MNKLITMVLLLVSTIGNAQIGKSDSSYTMAWDSTYREVPNEKYSITMETLKNPKRYITFMGKSINSPILKINGNGDIYYNPKYFCDCPKCKKSKGMVFLYNFLNTDKNSFK